MYSKDKDATDTQYFKEIGCLNILGKEIYTKIIALAGKVYSVCLPNSIQTFLFVLD